MNKSSNICINLVKIHVVIILHGKIYYLRVYRMAVKKHILFRIVRSAQDIFTKLGFLKIKIHEITAGNQKMLFKICPTFDSATKNSLVTGTIL